MSYVHHVKGLSCLVFVCLGFVIILDNILLIRFLLFSSTILDNSLAFSPEIDQTGPVVTHFPLQTPQADHLRTRPLQLSLPPLGHEHVGEEQDKGDQGHGLVELLVVQVELMGLVLDGVGDFKF